MAYVPSLIVHMSNQPSQISDQEKDQIAANILNNMFDQDEFVELTDEWFAEMRKRSVEALGEEEVARVEKKLRDEMDAWDKQSMQRELEYLVEHLYIYLYGVKPDPNSTIWTEELDQDLYNRALNVMKVKYGTRLNLPDHPRTDNL